MTLTAAFLLGLLASVHCMAMCGGIQGAITMRSQGAGGANTNGKRHLAKEVPLLSSTQAQVQMVLLNLGRVTSYVIAGAVLAHFGSMALLIVDVSQLAIGFRVMAGTVLILIGIGLLMRSNKLLSPLESIFSGVWKSLSRRINPRGSTPIVAYRNGLIWGTLPCGLSASMALVAAFSGSVTQGALLMLGFGLGTLPAMLGSGMALVHFKRAFQQRQTQIVTASILVLFGLMTATATWWVPNSFLNQYPQLASTMFCIT